MNDLSFAEQELVYGPDPLILDIIPREDRF